MWTCTLYRTRVAAKMGILYDVNLRKVCDRCYVQWKFVSWSEHRSITDEGIATAVQVPSNCRSWLHFPSNWNLNAFTVFFFLNVVQHAEYRCRRRQQSNTKSPVFRSFFPFNRMKRIVRLLENRTYTPTFAAYRERYPCAIQIVYVQHHTPSHAQRTCMYWIGYTLQLYTITLKTTLCKFYSSEIIRNCRRAKLNVSPGSVGISTLVHFVWIFLFFSTIYCCCCWFCTEWSFKCRNHRHYIVWMNILTVACFFWLLNVSTSNVSLWLNTWYFFYLPNFVPVYFVFFNSTDFHFSSFQNAKLIGINHRI